jgi:hypothetical protein
MGWVVYYAVLLFAFALSYVLPHVTSSATPDVLKAITGTVTLLSALGQAVAKVNLRFYLFCQRAWVWWNSDRSSIWRFGLRLDGYFDETVMMRIQTSLASDFAHWTPTVISKSDLEIRIKIDRTIHLKIAYEPRSNSEDGRDHLTIRSDELEISYGGAKSKIDRCISPLLSALVKLLRPEDYSAVFDIFFQGHNPFFAFYVAHLRPEQVSQFNLIFYPKDSLKDGRDKIRVTQDRIEITASTVESFGQLSKGMLLLSADSLETVEI